MKCVVLLVVVCGVNIVATDQPRSGRGSAEIQSVSKHPNRKEFVLYRMCFKSPPTFVQAQAKPANASLPHKFNATIFRIEQFGFIVDLKRTDQARGWDTKLVVDWTFHSGGGVEYGGRVVWMPDPSVEAEKNRSMAEESCGRFGGRLVDIFDKKMYDVVYDYVRNTSATTTRTVVWLGMNYNAENRTVTTSQGEPGYDPTPHNDWHLDTKLDNPNYTGMMVVVRSKMNPNSTGIRTVSPTREPLNVKDLCTISL